MQHALADNSVDSGRTRQRCLKGGNKLDQSGDALLAWLCTVARARLRLCCAPGMLRVAATRKVSIGSQVSSRAAPLTRCRTKTAARICTCEGSSCCEQLVHVADHAGRGLMTLLFVPDAYAKKMRNACLTCDPVIACIITGASYHSQVTCNTTEWHHVCNPATHHV